MCELVLQAFLSLGEDCFSKNIIHLFIYLLISLLVKNVLCALLNSAFCLKDYIFFKILRSGLIE